MIPMRGGTARTPERGTDGGKVGRFAAMLGTPLLPWQQYVADVAGEIDPETGTYFYDTVILSTPRQCGKSTLVDATDTRNAQWGPGRYIYYLAQTGKDAGDHFRKYLEKLHAPECPLGAIALKPYRGMGNLSQTFVNGSVIMPKSVTRVAGHGVQGDKITLDEAFSLSEETGNAILDGFLPTTVTRLQATGVQPQLWITSTEGTAESTFFNKRLDECRAGSQSRRTCWFDFGLPPDADPENLDLIMRYHPAAGLLWNRDKLQDFREQWSNNPSGWARAFGNRRDVGLAERIIDADTWATTAVAPLEPSQLDGRPVVFAVAVDVDGTHTSISAGICNDDGTITAQLLEILDGTGYAPEEISRLCGKYHAPVVIDSKGTASDLSDRLHRLTDNTGDEALDFVDMDATDYLTIGQSFVSGLTNRIVFHATDADLDESTANSARKWSGDAWRISRRGSTGLTSPLESCMLAAWGAAHRPEEDGPLQIY